MEYILPIPSLQHLAVVKIVTHLWNQPDILTLNAHRLTGGCFCPLGYTVNEATIERKVREKASALPLPKLCIRLLTNVIKPLKDEVFTWFELLQKILDSRRTDHNYFLKPLIWTTLATVDYKKMMQLIVKDETFYLAQRLKLACYSCLETETCELIGRIPEDQRQAFIKAFLRRLNEYRDKFHEDFMVFWTSGNVDKLTSETFQHLYVFAKEAGNRAACDYLFEKLSERDGGSALLPEINRKIIVFRPDCKNMYYFSRFSEQQREMALASCWLILVKSMLSWPYQALFVETIKRWSHLIYFNDYIKVLDIVMAKIIQGYQDYDYSRAFLDVWQLTPADVRKFYLSNQQHLQDLFVSGEQDLISLVLKEGSVDRIDMLVFEEYHAIKRALREESAISDHDLMEYRRNLKGNERIQLKCENILGLLDHLIGKRSWERYYEEGNF